MSEASSYNNTGLWARVLLLHDPDSIPTAGWQEIERRLPQAEHLGDLHTAARSLAGTAYDLIVADSALPGGGPHTLLGKLIARQCTTTVVVHYRLESGEYWLKLFEGGKFDLEAKPMTSQSLFRWLENWLATPARASVPAAA